MSHVRKTERLKTSLFGYSIQINKVQYLEGGCRRTPPGRAAFVERGCDVVPDVRADKVLIREIYVVQ